MRNSGPVVVMQLPQQLNHLAVGLFMNELQPLLEADRPRIVLDCSQIAHLDSAGVEMLLQCTEEVMKRDGDLKLADLSPYASVILELMRVDRLFEVFETAQQAVQSFHAVPAHSIPQSEAWYSPAYGALGDLEAAS
jgi:anti-sigma B factor antagonist